MQAYHAALLLFCIAGLYVAGFAASLLSYPLLAGILGGVLTLVLLHVCTRSRRSLLALFAWFYCLYVLLGWAAGFNQASFGLPRQRVVQIEGHLVEDSLLTRSNKQLARIALASCRSKDGFQATCRGTVSTLIEVDEVLVSSSNLVLTGILDPESGLFLAESVQVLPLSLLARQRRHVLRMLQIRLQQVIPDKASQGLAAMLLLGQTGSSDFQLKDLSLACGCAHLLALSGMHLHFFLSLSTSLGSLIVGRFWGRWLGSVPALFYVVLVGPKPSLIRALGMHLCSLFPISRQTAFQATFFLQLLLFPFSLSSMACLYSWAAYGMLLLSSMLPTFFLQKTAVIVAGSSPASLLLGGSCNLSGLLFSPILTPLINLAMAASFLSLVFGSFFGRILSSIQALLFFILENNQGYTLQVGFAGYVVYVLVLLTCLVSIGYATMAVQKRRRLRYELDIRIRLPDCNHCSAQTRGAVDDQEIWSELPHLPLGEGEDCSTSGCTAVSPCMGDRAGDRGGHQPAARAGGEGDGF